MKLEYNKAGKTFKVPKFSPLVFSKPGWSGERGWLKVGATIAYSKNHQGKYEFGTTDVVDYVSPKKDYVVVLVHTHVDSWYEILTEMDCIAETPQNLVDEMESNQKDMSDIFKNAISNMKKIKEDK